MLIPAFEATHGPEYQALFLIDNSQGHSTYVQDALLVSWMNICPGGKQACMHDSWFIQDGEKITQSMVFSSSHNEFLN